MRYKLSLSLSLSLSVCVCVCEVISSAVPAEAVFIATDGLLRATITNVFSLLSHTDTDQCLKTHLPRPMTIIISGIS